MGFKFILENTKVGSIYALNDGTNEEDIPVSELNNILQRQASAASKQFAQHNRVSERSHNVIISKSNLESKLASVVTHEQLSSVIEQMTKNNLINQLNSISYASEYTLSELISKLNLDEYLQDAKEEMKQATRDEHKLSLSEKHLMDSDSRELQASVRELTPQMITAKEKLTVAVYKAEANKKITAKKSELFLNELENSKTAQDLEEVAKKLRSYLK
ncbi:hypothetical protein D3C75_661220 [compost metagenome]